jgi:3'-phosphoadenosine 5'-phosphosulfate sulfotransferase (PAPS reductase)/FAD synthetase
MTTACRLNRAKRRNPKDGPVPHARLLPADRRRREHSRYADDIIQEMLVTTTSERQGRVIDHDQSASMEKKKQEGYF